VDCALSISHAHLYPTHFHVRPAVTTPLLLPPRDTARAPAPGPDRSTDVRPELLALLVCPRCAGALRRRDGADRQVLHCRACDVVAPIKEGIPRFVGALLRPDERLTGLAAHTQASFGYEWTYFHHWDDSGETSFRDCFATADLARLAGGRVLDVGCGMGRHARQMAAHARQVVAVDFSRAIDQAALNTRPVGNVDCVQADLLQLPFADATFDYVYSLGVLHHLANTETALHGLVAKLKPGGRLRVYLYWKRHGGVGALLRVVNAVRPLTTRLPFRLLRWLCWALSAVLWVAVIVPYRCLLALGARGLSRWPLFVYARYPFRILYNDQFDRFSAPLEKRYEPEDVTALLESAGLRHVRVEPRFGWIAEGVKPLGWPPRDAAGV
jgi:SAM-dependent methyltransferase